MNTIHIVDDDLTILESLQNILESEGYNVITADSPEKFLTQIKIQEPEVVIVDIFFGEEKQSGDEIVKHLSTNHPNCQTIVISGESAIEKTISSLKNGAIDFIEKPVSLPRLITTVKNAFNIYNIKASSFERSKILGESVKIKSVIDKIKKLANINETVLICGENGTGKELVAENLHLFSPNYTKQMIKVNCTALNPNLIESELFGHKAGSFTGAQKDKVGFFEKANYSTIFIDEIGDFELSLQSKILRVIQEKVITPVGSSNEIPINSKMLFATHRPLDKMVEEGSFREDLYFRLSTFIINIPPLRERLEDINVLANNFLHQFVIENKLSPKILLPNAIEKLQGYDYPGNIRELSKIIKNAAFFSSNDEIGAEDINFSNIRKNNDLLAKTKEMTLAQAKNFLEKEFLIKRLSEFNDDISKTADSLGILKNNLYRKIREHNIEV